MEKLLELIEREDLIEYITKILMLKITEIPLIKFLKGKRNAQKDKWIDYGKKQKTYSDMIMDEFKYSATMFILGLIVYTLMSYIVKLFYWWINLILALGFVLLGYLYRNKTNNEQLMQEIKNKKKHYLVKSIWLIQGFLLILAIMDIGYYYMLFILIIGWSIFFLQDWETKYVFVHRYIKITDKQNRITGKIEATKVEVKGSWISLPISKKGEIIERKLMRKKDIKEITYYGKPICITKKMRFYKIEEEVNC